MMRQKRGPRGKMILPGDPQAGRLMPYCRCLISDVGASMPGRAELKGKGEGVGFERLMLYPYSVLSQAPLVLASPA